ncbi:MAG: capsular biosynthesis protein [Cytophagaceae bacterium]|nr:capsular biosynthesis protein [Cytophagaceae bacterium]
MHSHVLPGIDDGAGNLDDSLQIIEEFIALGYKKIITTPHIMGDFFKNTPEIINSKLAELRAVLQKQKIEFEVEAAAEYYLDEWFMSHIQKEKPLLTFGDRYVLFETSYINESAYLTEAVFHLRSMEYRPVLAHPERYTYLYQDFKKFKEIYDKGVLFQVNLNSFSGYYSEGAKKFAIKLLENNMIDFAGSDCHGARHMQALKKTRQTKEYQKLLASKILNNTLL